MTRSGVPTNRELLEHIHQLLHHEESGLLAEQRRIKKELRKLMTILADIKTINAETKEKVIGLSTKLDSAIAKNAGYREAPSRRTPATGKPSRLSRRASKS